jgi:glucose-1-phosphate cytidylyltransferase
MKEYSFHGYKEFIICAGYKQHLIKQWFRDYTLYMSDITFHTSNDSKEVHQNHADDWDVTVVDTGLNTMTGGRVKCIQPYIGNDVFMLTYGDGVCDVDINDLERFHRSHGKIATLTSVMLEQQKGILDIENNNTVRAFREKNLLDRVSINAGYMVLNPQIFDFIDDDATVFERKPLETCASQGQLMSYSHSGFWQCMDTKRELDELERLWATGQAPWKKW